MSEHVRPGDRGFSEGVVRWALGQNSNVWQDDADGVESVMDDVEAKEDSLQGCRRGYVPPLTVIPTRPRRSPHRACASAGYNMPIERIEVCDFKSYR